MIDRNIFSRHPRVIFTAALSQKYRRGVFKTFWDEAVFLKKKLFAESDINLY